MIWFLLSLIKILFKILVLPGSAFVLYRMLKSRRKSKKAGEEIGKGFKIVLIVVALIFATSFFNFFGKPILIYASANDLEIDVTKTERAKNNDTGEEQYLVFSSSHGTFKIEDNWYFFQRKSSDLYGKIKPNQTYKIKCYGVRWGVRSWYPNIYSIEEVVEVDEPEMAER